LVRFASLALVVLACSVARAQPSTPIVLISVDTLRADHLGCYQSARVGTPHIDSLASNGTLFSQVNTPFPLTLPAHVSLFTSTYPFANGVQDNGFPLKATSETLATMLKKAGYRTGAFVGSFVLDRRFGLSRGFDVYDSPFDLHKEAATGAVERKRPAVHVVDAAKRWVERSASAPFFLFLHLYDLHAPYDLSESRNLGQGEAGYAAELAYVDRVLGDFLAFLDSHGILQKALIVFTSDHGEGLGDHGESSHGYFIYQSTLHVPLIIHWPANFKRHPQKRVDEPATLLDVTPTILDAIGLSPPREMHGRSLLGASSPEIYSESLYARNHFGCAVLRCMRAGRYKYIEAPKPELYDLATDPDELHNLYERESAIAKALGERIAAVRAGSPPGHPGKSPAPETINALRSLGYLSGSTGSIHAGSGVDPKDRIRDFERYAGALALASVGKLAESEAGLQKLANELPDVIDLRISLAMSHEQLGEYAEAARELKRVVGASPKSAEAHFDLGLCYLRLQQPRSAIQELNTALTLEPWYTRADELLAEVYVQEKGYPRARTHLNHLLSVDPHNYAAHYNLGVLAALQQNWTEAQQQVLSALQTDPASAEAHNTLGSIYIQRGELEQGRRQFEEAIRLQPEFAQAHYNLGMVLQQLGKQEQAAQEFRSALEADRSPAPVKQ
jgi:arylsulfatase A-like enzyme/Tfp pilus assembly protein PilF